jgi:hypothetical protein
MSSFVRRLIRSRSRGKEDGPGSKIGVHYGCNCHKDDTGLGRIVAAADESGRNLTIGEVLGGHA